MEWICTSNLTIADVHIIRWETKRHVNRKKRPWTARPKTDIGDVSVGSNPAIYTFCTLILNCLLLASDIWWPKLKEPVTLETQGLQVKNVPTRSEQLTTICSDWVGSFILNDIISQNNLNVKWKLKRKILRYLRDLFTRASQILCNRPKQWE